MNVTTFMATHKLFFSVSNGRITLKRAGTCESYIACKFITENSKIFCEVKKVSETVYHDTIQISPDDLVYLLREIQKKSPERLIPIQIENYSYLVNDFYLDARSTMFAFVSSKTPVFSDSKSHQRNTFVTSFKPILISPQNIIKILNDYIDA